MIQHGYVSSRIELLFALTSDDVKKLSWLEEITSRTELVTIFGKVIPLSEFLHN